MRRIGWLGALAALIACGGGDDGGDSGTNTTGTTTGGTIATAPITNGEFEVTFVETTANTCGPTFDQIVPSNFTVTWLGDGNLTWVWDDDPDPLDARQGGHPTHEVGVKASVGRWILQVGTHRRDLKGEHVSGVVARIDTAQRVETAQQQGRGDQQHERQGGLSHHQNAASPTPLADRAASAFPQLRKARC